MDKDLANTIGTAARAAREAAGLTQEEAAELIGVSGAFYARIERGGTLPSVPTLVRIADVLATDADLLLGRRPSRARTAEARPAYGSESEETPEIRKLLRRARRASPRVVRVLNLLAKELVDTAPTTRGGRSRR